MNILDLNKSTVGRNILAEIAEAEVAQVIQERKTTASQYHALCNKLHALENASRPQLKLIQIEINSLATELENRQKKRGSINGMIVTKRARFTREAEPLKIKLLQTAPDEIKDFICFCRRILNAGQNMRRRHMMNDGDPLLDIECNWSKLTVRARECISHANALALSASDNYIEEIKKLDHSLDLSDKLRVLIAKQ